MADVRALLKAKRQEARISHRYAAYNANGQLRCLACGIVIKHASAWEGHLGSKIHRSSVAQQREAEMEEEAKSRLISEPTTGSPGASIGQQADADDIPAKRRKLEQETDAPSPAVSEPPRISAHVAEEDVATAADVESEYRQFQQEVLTMFDADEKYEGATVVAEPQLFVDHSEAPTSTEKATVDENERKAEERELIMDRLLDEERAQEEADMRVNLMKKRLEAVKKKRRNFATSTG